jgi:hypothetical protein
MMTSIFLAVRFAVLNNTDTVKCISRYIIPLSASHITHKKSTYRGKRERMRAISEDLL